MRDLVHEVGQLIIATVAILAVWFMARDGVVNGDAAVGFLGAVLGYVFGRSVGSVQTARAIDRAENGSPSRPMD